MMFWWATSRQWKKGSYEAMKAVIGSLFSEKRIRAHNCATGTESFLMYRADIRLHRKTSNPLILSEGVEKPGKGKKQGKADRTRI